MGTQVRDEGVILKVLEKNPKGIRSTDLWFAVRGSVRSLTTFQKRLKHLEQMGRIQTKDDIDDMRATIITPTPKSQEASYVLEAIGLLERLYLRKSSRKVVRVMEQRPGAHSNEETQETGTGNLLLIAQETYLKSWKDKPPDVGDSGVYLWAHAEKAKDGTPEVHIHDLPKSMLDKLENRLQEAVDIGKELEKTFQKQLDVQKPLIDGYKQLALLMSRVRQAVATGSTPEEIADKCKQIVDEWTQIQDKQTLASLGTGHGETIPS